MVWPLFTWKRFRTRIAGLCKRSQLSLGEKAIAIFAAGCRRAYRALPPLQIPSPWGMLTTALHDTPMASPQSVVFLQTTAYAVSLWMAPLPQLVAHRVKYSWFGLPTRTGS